MIELKFPREVRDGGARAFVEAARLLFNSQRKGFRLEWKNHSTLQIFQSETLVVIKSDPSYLHEPVDEGEVMTPTT